MADADLDELLTREDEVRGAVAELEAVDPNGTNEDLWYGLGCILDLNPRIQDELLGKIWVNVSVNPREAKVA